MAVAALATLTGSSDNVHAVRDLGHLAQTFDLAHVSRNPARFDPHDLETSVAEVLTRTPASKAVVASHWNERDAAPGEGRP